MHPSLTQNIYELYMKSLSYITHRSPLKVSLNIFSKDYVNETPNLSKSLILKIDLYLQDMRIDFVRVIHFIS